MCNHYSYVGYRHVWLHVIVEYVVDVWFRHYFG